MNDEDVENLKLTLSPKDYWVCMRARMMEKNKIAVQGSEKRKEIEMALLR